MGWGWNVIAERALRLGPLGRRLLAAFLLVALVSVALVTVASLIGTSHGITATKSEQRATAAQATADAAGTAYAEAQGWQDADLRRASAIATAAGARLVVRDAQGEVVATPGHTDGEDKVAGTPANAEAGPEGSAGGASTAISGPNAVVRPVVVDGAEVGSVRLGFGPEQAGSGQQIAWTWTVAAALVAMLVATVAAWFVSRRITGPLTGLMAAVRSFAAGDRDRRAGAASVAAPGELGELARSFNASADSIELSEATRRRMAADVAHELRTPLAALQAGLEEVSDGLVEPDETLLRGLHAQSVRLGRIVSDLSELTNAEAAALTLSCQPVDLAALARDAVAAAQPMLEAVGVSADVEAGEGCWVSGDEGRLHQALSNLLSNAARYCRQGDRVTVSVTCRGADALLSVADTGPGIAPADLDLVFDRLWRGTADSDADGLGIGLAVVKSLVTAHGGEVSVTSQEGHGARFEVRLPRLPQSGSGHVQDG
ncbi:MAG: HAMP domain-containing histidine kinase [Actinobacteria bacterium]|nr:HAMP domain-containing histidine kinase [Actinomycetota bacterium]